VCSVWVPCVALPSGGGSSVGPSPLCGSPVWVPCVGPLCGSLVALRFMWHLLAWCLPLVHTLPLTMYAILAESESLYAGRISMYLFIYLLSSSYFYWCIHVFIYIGSTLFLSFHNRFALWSVYGRCSFEGLKCCSCRVRVCRGCCSLSACVCVCVWPVDLVTTDNKGNRMDDAVLAESESMYLIFLCRLSIHILVYLFISSYIYCVQCVPVVFTTDGGGVNPVLAESESLLI